jgi:hypothetical protein
MDSCPHPIAKKYCLRCIGWTLFPHNQRVWPASNVAEYLTRLEIHSYTDCVGSVKTVQCATEARDDYSSGCARGSRPWIGSRMATQPRMGLLPQRRLGTCGCHSGDIAVTRKNLEQPQQRFTQRRGCLLVSRAGFKLVSTRRIRRGHTLKIHSSKNS